MLYYDSSIIITNARPGDDGSVVSGVHFDPAVEGYLRTSS